MAIRPAIARATLVGATLSAMVAAAGCSHSANDAAPGPMSTPGPTRSGGSSTAPEQTAANSPHGHTRASGTAKLRVVPSVRTRTLPPVPITSPAAFGGGVSARVAKVAAQKQTDKGPGVIAGAPAVAFTLQFTNRSGKPISVNTVNVTATYGHNSPAVPANLSSNRPLRNDIRPGRTATGVYAFVIPKASRGKVSLAVWYAQGKPTVVFSGSVS